MEHKLTERKPARRPRATRPALVLFLAAGLGLAAADEAAEEAADAAHEAPLGVLEVRITGFDSADGQLAIALFATAADYATQSNALRKAFLEIRNGESHWQIRDLPAGHYALIAYHDENGNGEIDMRVLGMPKEPVGVSNDARGRLGPPRFEAARFAFVAPLTRHEIVLR